MFTKRTSKCVLATVLVLVFGSIAFAADIYVDVANGCPGTGTVGDPYCTIQLGVDNAINGDVIHVAAGVYDENVDIDVEVSIEGAGSGTTAADTIIDPTTGRGLYIHQSVDLKDLRVTGATLEGIRVEKSGGASLAFTDVTWENIASSANAGRGVEIHNDTDITNMVIANSEFVDNGAQGIRTASNVTVDGMTISDSVFDRNSYGLYLQGTLDSVTISDSTMNDNSAWGFYASETGPITDLTITGCEFNDNAAGFGIVLFTGAAGGIVGTAITTTQMDGNASGFWIGAPVITDFFMQCSSASNNSGTRGIEFNFGTLSNVVVVAVDIAGNAGDGLRNLATGTVSATGNWWGDASGPSGVGPGTGDSVTTGVTFSGWRAVAVPASGCLGPPLVPTVSEWGMAALVLLLLAGLMIKLALMRYREA